MLDTVLHACSPADSIPGSWTFRDRRRYSHGVKLHSASCSVRSRGGEVNEDALLADDGCGVYVVSDGVGRHRGADTASRLVVEHVAKELRRDAPPVAEARRMWLIGAAKKAAGALAAEAKKRKELSSMGATLTALRVVGEEAHLLHVGDSRAYRLRAGRLEQLTRDHSLAFEQFEAGAITKEQLRTHPNQKLLTRSLRASSTIVIPETAVAPIAAGDRFLLCTDGLTKDLEDEKIAELLLANTDLEEACRALRDAASAAGGADDTTLIVLGS